MGVRFKDMGKKEETIEISQFYQFSGFSFYKPIIATCVSRLPANALALCSPGNKFYIMYTEVAPNVGFKTTILKITRIFFSIWLIVL